MIVDLFAGPGGWSTGLNMIDRREDVGIEWDEAACATARAAGHERMQADIAELDPLTVAATGIEGLIASPPCQGFSMAGSGKGREDAALLIASVGDFLNGDPRETLHSSMSDDRSILALEPLRWVLALEPEWTTWEQVPAVLPLWEACAEVLRSAGYVAEASIVYAEALGVPQTRKRAILRARRGPLAPLRTTHSRYYPRSKDRLDPGVFKWVSMAEALGWGMTRRPSMTVTGGGTGSGGAEPFGNAARQGMVRELEAGSWIYRSTTMANSARRPLDCPAPTIAFGHDAGSARWIPNRDAVAAEVEPRVNNQSGTDFDLAWPADRPAPVIAGREIVTMPGANANRFNGSTKSRNDGIRVTVQEAATLQSFPHDYPWQGSKTAQYRQVGDAVPPRMAAHILASVGAAALPAWLAGPTTEPAAPETIPGQWALFDENEATA